MKRFIILHLLAFVFSVSAIHAGTTLAKVRRTHMLHCGIDQSEAEYSTTDEHGPRVDFDRDLCKAVAMAVIGKDAQIDIKGYPDDETASNALKSGEVDLIPSLSADLYHSSQKGILLTRLVFIDSVAVMVPRQAGIASVQGLSGKKICFIDETETGVSLHAWFRKKNLDLLPFPFQEQGEMEAAFATKNCAGIVSTQTRLAETRANFGDRANDYVILPGIIATDPMAMACRADDVEWCKALDWVVNALIHAEEHNITSKNVRDVKANDDPEVERLTGKTNEIGTRLSLENDWAVRMIQSVGNYGEMFSRDLGPGTGMNLDRGLNQLFSDGGMLYSLPLK